MYITIISLLQMEIVWPSQILKLSFAFIKESFLTFRTFTLIICKQIKLQQTSSSNEPQRDELQRDEPEPQRTAILYTINCTYTYWHSYLIHSHHSSLKHASSVLFLRFQMPWASWLLLPVLIRLRWRTTWKRYKLGQSKQLPPAASIKAPLAK